MTSAEWAKVARVELNCPPALMAARMIPHVEKESGETGYVKIYRKMMEENPKAFMAELRAMERDYLAAKVAMEQAKASRESEATLEEEECVKVLEDWLRRHAPQGKTGGG